MREDLRNINIDTEFYERSKYRITEYRIYDAGLIISPQLLPFLYGIPSKHGSIVRGKIGALALENERLIARALGDQSGLNAEQTQEQKNQTELPFQHRGKQP